MGKKVRPSPAATRRARQTRLYQALADDDNYFDIDLSKGNKVILFFAGYTVDFVLKEGQLTRGVSSCQYLNDNDWTFLNHIARKLMKAAEKGYRDKSNKTRKKKVLKFKSTPGQGILHLPLSKK